MMTIDFELRSLDITEIDPVLFADLGTPEREWTAWEHVCSTENGRAEVLSKLHICHHASARRGGVIAVASGPFRTVAWTYAETPEEALRRYLTDEIID
ncbi:hypothetical protein [Tropicimonas sp. IMCC6043]|uniref:hypothetical protein n=1 Tax=Tropicimonas sp. IMCC6043 TaxID=2510645 RepID=UPI00101C7F36|nr:hypothetical protein [Tropicimonas sp. IMCC6043]RYH12414.1 hypothetical protein EU800_02330 [Tropicimonas sp. IMCC6043]